MDNARKFDLKFTVGDPHGRFQLGADALFCFRHSIYRIDRIKEIGIGMGNGTLHSPTRISNNCNSVNSVNHVSEKKLHLELHFAAIVDDGDVLHERPGS